MKILLAEDEEHIAKLVEFKLQKEGLEVTWVPDGEKAVEVLDQGPWDLILLDIMMPKLDGWEVLRRVRVHDSVRNVPVLMLTAKGQDRDRAEASELGATDFVNKPFDPQELADCIRKTIEREKNGSE